MNDRIEEIKVSIAGYDDIDNDSLITAKGVAGLVVDAKYMLREIDRLKMMLDAAASGQETMQRKMADRNENLRLDYLDAAAERDAAVADLNFSGSCDTCKNDETLGCHVDAETGSCNYEWRGVQK